MFSEKTERDVKVKLLRSWAHVEPEVYKHPVPPGLG
jgi:hypothetical protein